jgi:N-acetyl-alpha-D-glucosaminyl L-malate synthase BshA
MLAYPLFEHQPYSLALATKMVHVAESEKLDLLHVHYAIPHSISAFLAREMLKHKRYLPVVTTLHGTDITLVGADRSYLPITKFGIERSDGVTAISQYLRKLTCETFDLCDVEVIYNFICPTDYKRKTNERLHQQLAPNGEKLLVHVSNFRPVKRIADCVDILQRLKGRVKARLVMVGDGPDRSLADWLAKRYGISDDVIFVGKQPRIIDYLSAADVLLLPSETESFGLSALEAMACEVPVVASNVGGLPEVVEDGVTGFLCPVGDVDAMAEKAYQLLTNSDMNRTFAERGRARAIKNFHTDMIIPQYERYYERVLSQPSMD